MSATLQMGWSSSLPTDSTHQVLKSYSCTSAISLKLWALILYGIIDTSLFTGSLLWTHSIKLFHWLKTDFLIYTSQLECCDICYRQNVRYQRVLIWVYSENFGILSSIIIPPCNVSSTSLFHNFRSRQTCISFIFCSSVSTISSQICPIYIFFDTIDTI